MSSWVVFFLDTSRQRANCAPSSFVLSLPLAASPLLPLLDAGHLEEIPGAVGAMVRRKLEQSAFESGLLFLLPS